MDLGGYGEIDLLKEAVRFNYIDDVTQMLPSSRVQQSSASELRSLSYVLQEAVTYKQAAIARYLIETGVPITATVVKAAAKLQSQEMLALLFDLGWSVNKRLGLEEPSVLSVVLDKEDFVVWLLSMGANPNARCGIDLTPLSYAVQQSPLRLVQLLAQHAPTLARGHLMHCAVWRELKDTEPMIRFLASAGAPVDNILYQDPKSRFRYGQFTLGTPLYEACKLGHVAAATVLLELGANADQCCRKGGKAVPMTPRIAAGESGCKELVDLLAVCSPYSVA